ncbi:MAG: hypothetical protein HY664_05585 [Chloroflexi bacterium]|nr:hypothetical protein [Chloroflexota bacterium]
MKAWRKAQGNWSIKLRHLIPFTLKEAGWRNNLTLGLLALGLATALWATITNVENPLRTDTFTTDIPVGVINPPTNLDVAEEIKPVRLRITAPSDLWGRLDPEDFKATADLSGAQAGVQEVRVTAKANDRRVKVVQVIPTQVRVVLETLEERDVPIRVQFQGSASLGYSVEGWQATPSQVTVRGPITWVNQVDSATAYIDLKEKTSNIKQSFKLSPLTTRGYEIKEVSLSPDSATIEVSIIRQMEYRTLSVLPQSKGTVASGYWVSAISIQPPVVIVLGPKSELDQLDSLRTEAIDITGANADIVREVPVQIPKGVTAVGTSSVTIKVSVAPSRVSRIFSLAPTFVGVRSRQVFYDTEASVTVAGDMNLIQGLVPSDISLVIDVSNLGPGFYSLKPQLKMPKGVEIVSLEPERIGITIK